MRQERRGETGQRERRKKEWREEVRQAGRSEDREGKRKRGREGEFKLYVPRSLRRASCKAVHGTTKRGDHAWLRKMRINLHTSERS